MLNDDWIMRQIEMLARAVGELLFQRETEEELLDEAGNFSGEIYLQHRLDRLLADGAVNEAENLLFEQLEAYPDEAHWKLALAFYARLQQWSDEALAAGDFSREEIAEGVRDLRRLWESRTGQAATTEL